MPSSARVKTGGGGLHIFYAIEGLSIKNRVNIYPGIDIRGEGGYVVAPPSLHASGSRYEWCDRSSIALLPEWLSEMLCDSQTLIGGKSSSFLQGSRNQTLTSIAGFLRKKGLNKDQLNTILEVTNRKFVCRLWLLMK